MIPPASTRRLSNLLAKHRDESLRWDLVVNVRSQGRWVAFAGHKSLAKNMLCPGMFDFCGDPSTWSAWGKHAAEPWHAERIWLADRCPILAPLGSYGIMVVDYDDRHVLSLQGYGDAIGYSSLSLDEKKPESVLMRGLKEHLVAGNIPRAGLRGGEEVALPHRPARMVGNPLSWVIRAMANIHKTTTRHIRDDKCVELPLAIPGWTLEHMLPHSSEAVDWMVTNGHLLHQAELEAWEAWATSQEYEPLAAAARSVMLASKLGASPPPRPRSGSPALPRL